MNTSPEIYHDIAARCGGDIYIGVVGPVRTGKSTFIKRFMEQLVIPNIENVYIRERARDELPQSGSGRTIMTAEPKFVPEDAVSITLEGDCACSVRLVDCVGYMVPGAEGLTEDGEERMVMTPWYDTEITMTQAAEEGTRRVISEHSSIGLLVTTDGSVCGIPRDDYVPAEERSVRELEAIGKPFVILLNCTEPDSSDAKQLAQELEEKYSAACLPVNCLELDASGIEKILKTALYEFPLERLDIFLPGWTDALEPESEIKASIIGSLSAVAGKLEHLRDVSLAVSALCDNEMVTAAAAEEICPAEGRASIRAELPQSMYYKTMSEESGFEISCDAELMELLRSLKGLKSEYDRVANALNEVRLTGYGIVMPSADEMRLEEPEIVRQGSRYGVRLKASAPAIHMIQTDVETEVSPALGGEKASDEIMGFLLQDFDGDMSRIWESNLFGRSMYDIASESVAAKLSALGTDTQTKLRQTLSRITNEGSGGLICIIL